MFALLCNLATAQKLTLEVRLKTQGRDSVINASIQLFSLPDSVLLQSQVSQSAGNRFPVHGNSTYLIRASAIGFQTTEKRLSVQKQSLSVTITMKTAGKSLQAVTVTAAKPAIRQEGEKTIIDAEPIANSSTNAYEVMEKTPGAIVDQDGNVYLNSTTPATIYINGVQMKMSTDDIASLLKSLPAGSVSRIEIIRTPSAKYDASNSGGIINIVLKKGTELGTSGSVNLRDDQGVYNSFSAGFSVNRRFGKLRTYLSYQYTHRNYYEDITSDRVLGEDTLLQQHSFTRYSPITHYIGAGADMVFNNRFDISYDLRLTDTRNNSQASSDNLVTDSSSQQVYQQTQSPISNTGTTLFLNNTLVAKYKLDSMGSEWSGEVDYNYSANPNNQVYAINYLVPVAPILNGNGHSEADTRYLNLKTDLTLQLKQQFTLETGLKLSYARNDYDADYFKQTGMGPKLIDSFQTNTFQYREQIGSAYLQLTKILSGFTLKGGLRMEHTNMNGHQLVMTDTSFTIDRYDLFPYVFIQHNLFKILGYPLEGHVLYRRSITRPTYDQLNPAPKFIDPFTYSTGNPGLQPQFTNNVELNATYNDFPVFAIGVNNTSDVFSPVTYQNNNTGIAFRTYDNLGSYKEIYGRLFGGLPTGHRYFMYAGVQVNYSHYNGSYQGSVLDYSRTSWTFYTGNSFNATPTLNFRLNAWMYVNGFRQFYELKTLGAVNMSITKNLLNKKLSIILFGNDILKTNVSHFHLQQGSVWVNGTRVQDSQRFGITLRYNFGFLRTEEKKPDFNPPPEASNNNQ
ncbi:MAG TPA: TonB-dependent receptor [Puia sp.]|nr:TonB-dependent receptor [Puia sp.]